MLAETVHSVVDTFNQVQAPCSLSCSMHAYASHTSAEHPCACQHLVVYGVRVAGARQQLGCQSWLRSLGPGALDDRTVLTCVGTCAQVLLRVGIVRSKRAPTKTHPYGYMKDKFVWSLVSAVRAA